MPTLRRLVFAAIALAALAAHADERSEAAASDLLHSRLKNEAPEDARLLGAVQGKDIVVVRGSMDRIEDVLKSARIRHTLIDPSQVAEYPLRNSMILMVNCPGVMPNAGVARIEKFVRAGGLLYTTDWSLLNVVQRAFPGTIQHNGGSTGDEVVPVRIVAEDDNLISRMLLREHGTPQWWLEGGSYPIAILDRERVKVLASSPQMGRSYGASPVVVRFRWHDGEVIHVVSHFVRQLATKGPKVAAKDSVDSYKGISDKDKAAFKASAGAGASAGDVESSYAFQAMTANLVVGKQRRNDELDRQYDMKPAEPIAIAASPDAPPPPTAPKLTGEAKLRILARKGASVQVRDDAGNEGWVPASSLSAR